MIESTEIDGKLRRRKGIKIICPQCLGKQIAIETYPESDCSICDGLGYIFVEEI